MKKLSNAEQEKVYQQIARLIRQIAAYHFYEWFVADKIDDVSVRAVQHNAALDSALINVRAFDEFFFKTSTPRPDALRFSQMSQQRMETFLSREDRDSINIYLAHLTTFRLDRQPGWIIDKVVGLALDRGVSFLKAIPQDELIQQDVREDVDFALQVSVSTLERLQKQIESQKEKDSAE